MFVFVFLANISHLSAERAKEFHIVYGKNANVCEELTESLNSLDLGLDQRSPIFRMWYRSNISQNARFCVLG